MWKAENEAIIFYDLAPVRTEEQKKSARESLMKATRCYKKWNLDTAEDRHIYSHLVPEDMKVLNDFLQYENMSLMTMKNYASHIFGNRPKTLLSTLKANGVGKISDLVPCEGKDTNPEDDSFQFKFIVPGSSFKQSVDLNTKQFANEK